METSREEVAESALAAARVDTGPQEGAVSAAAVSGGGNGHGSPNPRPASYFVGREAAFASIADALATSGRAQIIPATPSQGGLGLSRVAEEHLLRNRSSYQHVARACAASPLSLTLDLAQIAEELGLRTAQQKRIASAAEATLRWLEHHSGWLLILDDVCDADCLKPYLDRLAGGHIITTSFHELPDFAPAPKVGLLARHETLDWLTREVGDAAPEPVRALAEALGDLPMAVHLATSCIKACGMPVDDYLRRFLRMRDTLFGAQKRALPHASIVLAALSVTNVELTERHAAAPKLLALLAHMASHGISATLLAESASCCPRSLAEALGSAEAAGALLATLESFGLLQSERDGYFLHPMLARLVCSRVTKEVAGRYVETALRMVNHVFPQQDDYERTRFLDLLLCHGQAAAVHAERLDLAAELAGAVRGRLGLYLRSNGLPVEARTCFELAVHHGKQAYGDQHLAVATRANNLGATLRDLGMLEEARTWYEQAYRIVRAICEDTDANIAPCLNNLCLVCEDQGDLTAAATFYGEAVSFYERACGEKDPRVAVSLSNLGRVLRGLGRREEARRCYARALEIDEADGHAGDSVVATRLYNLATALFELGRHGEARETLEQALNLDMAANGADHLSTARDLALLGLVLKAENNLNGAKTMLQRALAIEARHVRGDGNRAADIAVQLGKVHRALGDLRRAQACFERALAFHESRAERDDEEIIHDLSNLGTVMQAQGDLDSARGYAERALKVAEGHFGTRAARTTFFVNRLGQVLLEQRDYAAARACFERAHAIDTAVHGGVSAPVARDLNNLGRVLSAMGNTTTAFAHVNRALEIARSVLGDRHPRTRAIRQNLDSMLV